MVSPPKYGAGTHVGLKSTQVTLCNRATDHWMIANCVNQLARGIKYQFDMDDVTCRACKRAALAAKGE